MVYKFSRKSAYRGTLWFDCYGQEEGSGELELRMGLDDSERAELNYTPEALERDVLGSIGVLQWRHGLEPVPQAMLDAFNAWRLAEHSAAIAKMDAAPERYGLTPDDPLRTPPPLAWAGGQYMVGEGWKITARAAGTDRAEARGRADYEADVRRRPLYTNGRQRAAWGQLGDVERETWRRPYRTAVAA